MGPDSIYKEGKEECYQSARAAVQSTTGSGAYTTEMDCLPLWRLDLQDQGVGKVDAF